MFFDEFIEDAAGDEFHDDIGVALGFSDGIDFDDVVVIDGGLSAGFFEATVDELFVIGKVVLDEFDGDGAVECVVESFVDGAHCAFAENTEQSEASHLSGDGGLFAAFGAADGLERYVIAHVEFMTTFRTGNLLYFTVRERHISAPNQDSALTRSRYSTIRIVYIIHQEKVKVLRILLRT